MKHIAAILFFFAVAIGANAQTLQAHAGIDTVICPSQFGAPQSQPQLGAPATGGVPPYTYLWTGDDGAGDDYTWLLDSPTRARPRVVTTPAPGAIDSAFFTVQATDALGATSRDTVLVRFSHWIYVTVTCMRPQSGSDTVHFSNSTAAGSNFWPFSNIRWTPSPFLSDTTVDDPKCWAPPGMFFYKYGTDRAGCRGSIGGCGTYFLQTSIAGAERKQGEVVIVPSPAMSDSRIEISPDFLGCELRIFSADGKGMRTMKLHSLSTPLSSANIPPGHYFYRITRAGALPLTGRLVMK